MTANNSIQIGLPIAPTMQRKNKKRMDATDAFAALVHPFPVG